MAPRAIKEFGDLSFNKAIFFSYKYLLFKN